jgi:hypothetical protein
MRWCAIISRAGPALAEPGLLGVVEMLKIASATRMSSTTAVLALFMPLVQAMKGLKEAELSIAEGFLLCVSGLFKSCIIKVCLRSRGTQMQKLKSRESLVQSK